MNSNFSFLRKMLLAKIHGATVTEANVNYEGSVTIPHHLLELTGLLPHEAVHVWNVTRGTRFETYIIDGGDRIGELHINGAAAHLAQVGDVVIIAGFVHLSADAAMQHQPKVVFLNRDNSVRELRAEQPGTIVSL